MHRFLPFFLIAVLASSSHAQELMPPHVAKQLGLTQEWLRPLNTPSGAQTIADIQIFVHDADPLEYVEIVQVDDAASDTTANDTAANDTAANDTAANDTAANDTADSAPTGDAATETTASSAKAVAAKEGQPVVFGRIEIGRVGKPTSDEGRVEANRLASNQARRLKRRGFNVELKTRIVPRINMYSIADNGMLESRNAETGEIHWTVQLGDPRLPYFAIGVDDDHLGVVNGDRLIKVNARTGEEISSLETRGTPMFGAINAGDFALIPMVSGSVEGYPLSSTVRDPFLRSTSGSALAMPIKSPDSTMVAWATDRGYVFVAETSGKPSVLFRLKTDGIVSGRVASAPGNRFFFGSENGQVYGLRASRLGEVLWSQSYGEPFYNEPVVVGKEVLISSAYGNLVSFDTETGMPRWNRPIPNVGQLIGAFGNRLYFMSLSGALGVVDLETGVRVGVYAEVRPGRLLMNRKTDRLYLVNSQGYVQCMRPEGADLPTLISAPDVVTKPEPAADARTPAEAPSPFDPGMEPSGEDVDPFGLDEGGDDPFGMDGDDFGNDDPFAEDN